MENDMEIKDLLRRLIESNERISKALEDLADAASTYVFGEEDEDGESPEGPEPDPPKPAKNQNIF